MTSKYTIKEEKHEWTSEKKLEFCGYGEWVEEADAVVFEYLGYEGLVYRTFKREPFCEKEAWFGGHLCGYVVVPKEHPYFGKDIQDIDIDCHRGLTYSEANEEHVIGFDCGHSGDYVPTMEYFKRTNPRLIALQKENDEMLERLKINCLFKSTYKNIEYCINECVKMIDQLVSVAEKQSAEK